MDKCAVCGRKANGEILRLKCCMDQTCVAAIFGTYPD